MPIWMTNKGLKGTVLSHPSSHCNYGIINSTGTAVTFRSCLMIQLDNSDFTHKHDGSGH